ncbi:MAG: DUF3487 family protein [Candidatus Sedimenticola endophacoides]
MQKPIDTTDLGHGVLADRVDGEPPAVLGLSATELMIVFSVVALVLLPFLLVLGALLHAIEIVLALTGFVFLIGVWVGAIIFRRLKRGRPLGYYQVRFSILGQRLFGGRRFILRSGPWDVGRTVDQPLRLTRRKRS